LGTVYAKCGRQKECIMGNWKIENRRKSSPIETPLMSCLAQFQPDVTSLFGDDPDSR